MIATHGAPHAAADAHALPEHAPLDEAWVPRPHAALARETLARWSGVVCLYAGAATALACLWSPT